jgi:hypothetical protein
VEEQVEEEEEEKEEEGEEGDEEEEEKEEDETTFQGGLNFKRQTDWKNTLLNFLVCMQKAFQLWNEFG